MDLILRNARVESKPGLVDIAVSDGRIASISDASIGATAKVPANVPRAGEPPGAQELDVGGRFVSPGLVETHLHLDKSCILERCVSREGTLAEAIAQVAAAKSAFTAADVQARAARTLERAILQGTTHMRTQLEVDPGIGLRGLDGVLPLLEEYRFAIDVEICVFPQEGLTNNPGTEELLVECLRRGAARVLGAAPYVDTDPHGQIDRVFALARDFDVDVDMHLDFTLDVARMDVAYVCEATRRNHYEGRVTIGHVSTLSALPSATLGETAARLRDAGVAVTVMPATDLFLMGRGRDHDVPRGVAPVHRLAQAGVNGSLSTNNVLNPFTPFGDCSLMRMANLYANACQVGDAAGISECYRMITSRAADILKVPDYGVAVGKAADLVVFDCESAAQAVAEIAPPLWAFKRGRMTVSRAPAVLHRP